MQGYRPEQLVYRSGDPSQVDNLYTRAMLMEAFTDFAYLKISDSVIAEGARHAGTAALMDLVGRK